MLEQCYKKGKERPSEENKMEKRSGAHLRAQKNGKIRDLYTCQICGSKENVEGHHILDYSFGGAPLTANIITLCHTCHERVHKGKIGLVNF